MCSMSLNFNQKQTQSLKQMQRLIMSPQMQQALHLMQLPIMELSAEIEQEMEQNPVLEYLENEPGEPIEDTEQPVEKELDFNENDLDILKRLDEDFRDHFSQSENYYLKRSQDEDKLKSFLEQSVQSTESLYGYLLRQSKETFNTDREISMAEALIGNFNENGFLGTDLSEIALLNNFTEPELFKVLQTIQQFDPPGVGVFSLQQSLLIQLDRQGKKNTLAYKIIERRYDDLLHNRVPVIKRAFKCEVEDIKAAIEKDISQLDLHPGASFSTRSVQTIVPDVYFVEEDGKIIVSVNQDYVPNLRLNRRYLKMLNDESLPKETKDFIKNKLVSAKWLIRNLFQRSDAISRLSESLSQIQNDFLLNPEGKLIPLTMKQIADELEVHESTIARAVMHKYASTPKGVFPLRFFFTNSYTTEEGEDISSKTVRDEIKTLIFDENKKYPLSDEKISQLLHAKGIPCARRTIAKYRSEMNIGNVNQRKEY